MIYETQEKNTDIIGEARQNKVSIQEQDMDFILTILSSNLYSDPISSLIREYVSNAQDSHREAGVDEPIVVWIDKDETKGTYFFKVQDFGVGISKERFYNTFTKLGSSTKRDSNEFIGMWGLGRLSGLSFSNQIIFTSVYNGTKTKYLMYKDGTEIHIDELVNIETDEPNGVEVHIDIKEEYILHEFVKKMMYQLQFFENVYIKTSLDTTDFYPKEDVSILKKFSEYYEIKKYNSFMVSSLFHSSKIGYKINNSIRIVIGQVTYPINFDMLKLSDSQKYLTGCPVYLRFEIGDLDVTPNREEILYSKKSIKKIEEKFNEFEKEFYEVYSDELNKNFTSPYEYYREVAQDDEYITLFQDSNGHKIRYSAIRRITFNDVTYSKTLYNFLSRMYHFMIASSIRSVYHGSIETQYFDKDFTLLDIYRKYLRNVDDGETNPFNGVIEVYDLSLNKRRSKQYYFNHLHEKNNGYSCNIVNKNNVLTYDNFVDKTMLALDETIKLQTNKESFSEVVELALKELEPFFDELLKSAFTETMIPIDYKYMSDKVRASRDSNYITLYVAKDSDRFYDKQIFRDNKMSKKEFEKKLDEVETIFVWGEKENSEDLLLAYNYYSRFRGKRKPETMFNKGNLSFAYITVSNVDYMKDLESKNPKIMHISRFLSTENTDILNSASVMYVRKNIPNLNELTTIKNIDIFNYQLSEAIEKYIKLKEDYLYEKGSYLIEKDNASLKRFYEIAEEANKWNDNIIGFIKKYKTIIEKAAFILVMSEFKKYSTDERIIPEDRINIITDYIITKGLFQVKQERIDDLKEFGILNSK